VEFETTTLLVYTSNPDAPAFSDEQLDEIQAGHMAHLQSLGERGLALTAGPFSEQTDPRFRGLVFFSVDPVEALRLTKDDPAVIAGRLLADVMNWHRQAGTVIFTHQA
jgi:uncharacterized protein YciI